MPKYYYEQIIRKRLAWILMYKQINNVSKGCLHFGISRKRFYKWLKRYEGGGKKVVVINGGSKEEGKNFQCE